MLSRRPARATRGRPLPPATATLPPFLSPRRRWRRPPEIVRPTRMVAAGLLLLHLPCEPPKIARTALCRSAGLFPGSGDAARAACRSSTPLRSAPLHLGLLLTFSPLPRIRLLLVQIRGSLLRQLSRRPPATPPRIAVHGEPRAPPPSTRRPDPASPAKIRDLLAPCVCVPARVARPAGSSALLRPTAAVGLAACTRFPSPSIPCSVPAKSGPHPRHPSSGRLHSMPPAMRGRRRQFLAPPPTSVASLRSAPASSPSHHHQPLPLHLTVQKQLDVRAD